MNDTESTYARKCEAHKLAPRVFTERGSIDNGPHFLRCDSGCSVWGANKAHAFRHWNEHWAVPSFADQPDFAKGGVFRGKSIDNAARFPKDGLHIETPVEKLCNAHRLIDEATLALVEQRDRDRDRFAALEHELSCARTMREADEKDAAIARDERDKLKLQLADAQQALVLIREQRDDVVGKLREAERTLVTSVKQRNDEVHRNLTLAGERDNAMRMVADEQKWKEKARQERDDARAQHDALHQLLRKHGVAVDDHGVYTVTDTGSRTYLRADTVAKLRMALEQARASFDNEMAVARRERDEAEADLFTAREDVRRLMDEQAARKLSAG